MNASAISTAILLACLSELESGNNDLQVGLAGEVSRYQIKPEVWREQTSLPIERARAPKTAKAMAWMIQDKRLEAFRVVTGRQPSVREWYILWNAPAQAYRGKPSKAVAKRAERFSNLVEASVNLKGR